MDCVRWSSIVTAGELKSLEWTYVTAAEGDRLIVSHHGPEFAKPARDTLDGHFVPNLTIGPPVVASVRKVTRVPLNCHLMIAHPDESIPVFAEAGVD